MSLCAADPDPGLSAISEPLRDGVGERAAELASAAGITIEHIAKNHIRKETSSPGCLSSAATVRPGAYHLGDGSLPHLQALA